MFNFSLQEILSYSGSIKVEIKSTSSIPDEVSYIEYNMYNDEAFSTFVGPQPCVFSFLAIASIFESEIAGDPEEK